ncbi:TPA: hypothetical protein RZK36_001180 [Campylobacter coli]|nr:hypothetical protein [Campylobacter jejuni]OOX90282.1 hypothetical protein BOQ00_02065 [Campylobacter coli]OOY02287.1 hypothetical protein BOQ02_01915 [Campylobacter coli]HEB9289076.1 hypothetical protein [Campylobacter coli]HEB9336439.1 hypothetical protein [Campylobacter coli]
MKKIIVLCALVNISFSYSLLSSPDSCYAEEQNYEDAIKYYESFQSDYYYKNAIEAKRKLERCYREKQLEYMKDVKRKLNQNW